MSFNNDDRQMYDVDLTCAKCGAHISQLPFQPTAGRPVYCSDCNRAFRDNKRQRNNSPRRMYDVDIECAGCGSHISQLPFQPTGDKPIYCRECLAKNRAQ